MNERDQAEAFSQTGVSNRAAWNWPSRDAPASRKRQANEFMRDGLRRYDPNEPIPFFCECPHPDCFRIVWLNGVAYDRLRAAPQAHALSAEHSIAVRDLRSSWPGGELEVRKGFPATGS